MSEFIEPLELLVEQFRKLPGVGRKSAVRMAFGIIAMSPDEARAFTDTVYSSRCRLCRCRICHNLCEGELCPICEDEKRDAGTICVVEDAKAVMALEKMREYNGVYHVLGGTISPIDGRGPGDLQVSSLLERLRSGEVREVVVATNPTTDGETTALYLARLLKPFGVRVTRLAYGIPVGGDLDYADELTLLRAMAGRKEIQ